MVDIVNWFAASAVLLRSIPFGMQSEYDSQSQIMVIFYAWPRILRLKLTMEYNQAALLLVDHQIACIFTARKL
jgi:hypothetical protein